jgi:hypothetical protein
MERGGCGIDWGEVAVEWFVPAPRPVNRECSSWWRSDTARGKYRLVSEGRFRRATNVA